MPSAGNPRLTYVVESATDVRVVEALAEDWDLTILARWTGPTVISQPTDAQVRVIHGPSGRGAFVRLVLRHLMFGSPAPDVVLGQNYGPSALAVNVAARARRLPAVMLVGNDIEAYYRARRGSPYGPPFRRTELLAITAIARANARVAQHFVAVSEHLAAVLRRHGTRCPVDVIPFYGVDCSAFRPPERARSEIRQELGLPADGALLFFSSRIAHEKDIDTLLAAFGILRGEGKDVWLLNRSGGHRRFLEAASAFGVNDRVIATDAVHPLRKLPKSYQASDLCIQASRAEGLGISPLEALACECPVVASNVGGLKETIREGETGWTYPPGDARTLAAQIQRALADPTEAARRARRGRRMVEERFEATQATRRFREALVRAAGLTSR